MHQQEQRRGERTVLAEKRGGMKVTVVGFFLLCFLISASLVNAESILVKKERTASGRMHYSFSNTAVNEDRYQDALEFTPMSARERAQADAISREDAANQQKDRDHYRKVNAEMEQERLAAKALKQAEEFQRREELRERKNRAPIVVNPPAVHVNPTPVFINNW